MRVGIVTLVGNDGASVSIVPAEIVEWIKSPVIPIVKDQYLWHDPTTPEILQKARVAAGEPALVPISYSTGDNDRALHSHFVDLDLPVKDGHYLEGPIAATRLASRFGHEVVDEYIGMEY
jgi:hypothetical protein